MSPIDTSVPIIAVAVDAASVERPVIDAWASEQDPPVTVVLDAVTGAGDGLGAALAAYDDALVVPVRVAWLPDRRAPGRARPGSPSWPCWRRPNDPPPGCPAGWPPSPPTAAA